MPKASVSSDKVSDFYVKMSITFFFFSVCLCASAGLDLLVEVYLSSAKVYVQLLRFDSEMVEDYNRANEMWILGFCP
ncbi:hypothetical protein RIF29_00750 [Crotalaria pallida]|uniref:Uncharacterized protein n=1 Tax=Crotalaria pallida TaxID=3830 RepID=A0AAN9IW15_CROPI